MAMPHPHLSLGRESGLLTLIIKITNPTRKANATATQGFWPNVGNNLWQRSQSIETTAEATAKELNDCGVMKTPTDPRV